MALSFYQGSLEERGILSLRATLSDPLAHQAEDKLSQKSEVLSHEEDIKDDISIKEDIDKSFAEDVVWKDSCSKSEEAGNGDKPQQSGEEQKQENLVDADDDAMTEGEDHIGECHKAYDLPFGSDWMRQHRACTYVPFLPSYIDRPVCKDDCCTSRCKKSQGDPEPGQVNEGYASDLDGCEKVSEMDAQSRLWRSMLPRSFRSPSVKQSLQDRTDIWRHVTI